MVFLNLNSSIKKRTFLIVCFFSIQVNLAKPLFIKFYNNSNYESKIEECSFLLSQKDIKDYKLGLQKTQDFENELILKKDFLNLPVLYINIALIYYNNKDMSLTNAYLNKGIKILKKHPNDKILGFYYELYYASLASVGNYELSENYLIKTKYYLEKYVPIELRVDLYYNLTTNNERKQNWAEVVKYGKLHDSINLNILKIQTSPNLYLMLGKAYLNTNKIEETKKIISKVENLDEFKTYSNRVLHRYYELKANLAFKEKNNVDAIKYYQLALKFRDLNSKETLKKFNNFAVLENKILKTNYDLENERINNQLKNSQIKLQKSLLIYLLVSLGFLILIIVLQFRYTKAKSKINEVLNEKNELLKDALDVRNKFLDIIAHELRTPLNAISSIVYLFKDKNVDKQNIEILEYSTDYLKSLSNNIIEYNVLNNNKDVKLKLTSNSLEEIIKNCVVLFEKVNINENLFQIEFDNSISKCHLIDKSRLIQVLNNLIDNANKFTYKGLIKISATCLNINENFQTIRIGVEDEGIGVEDFIKDKIFDMFFQGSEEISLKYGGSGIGLALVKSTLKMFESKLNLKSKEKGAHFYFDLKLKIDPSTVNQNTISNEVLGCNFHNVLVVEDNKINQILVKKILMSKGYSITIAENGLEALEIIKDNEFCLILMDIMMPIMDGFKASDEISKIKPHIPIVALTAVSEELNKEKFLKVKIRKVLNKPINIDELTQTVNQYCLK
ncbi:response regulator [Flavobacterium sp. LMO8]|uniref:ATP-binding response regulator n=1 Tax=Flavobacterium sp. LMO8 TaxID=2654244 RepID=UPI0012924CEA|nr:response regulator [Flavobacterium sp. LMO8]MQP25879.1 response regulator [Flavobacterium sp. LMO8]